MLQVERRGEAQRDRTDESARNRKERNVAAVAAGRKRKADGNIALTADSISSAKTAGNVAAKAASAESAKRKAPAKAATKVVARAEAAKDCRRHHAAACDAPRGLLPQEARRFPAGRPQVPPRQAGDPDQAGQPRIALERPQQGAPGVRRRLRWRRGCGRGSRHGRQGKLKRDRGALIAKATSWSYSFSQL